MKRFAQFALIIMAGAVTSSMFGQSAPAASADPDAMRKIAEKVPKLDIVGIKLGMSPQEAMAAIKAANPKLKVDLLNARMQRPGVQQFDKVPHWMVAHTIGVAGNFAAGDHSKEVIAVEFTMPPGHSVVARVMREVTFPDSEPVLASNLIGALHKKYGEGEFINADRIWMFDASGKLIAQAGPLIQRSCVPTSVDRAFPMMGGRDWLDYSAAHEYGEISLNSTTQVASNTAETQPGCTSLALVQASALGDGIPGTMKVNSLTVSIESSALLYGSRKAAHDWLQRQADGIQKQQDDAASKRGAPKL